VIYDLKHDVTAEKLKAFIEDIKNNSPRIMIPKVN
jgi:hypothetical protein